MSEASFQSPTPQGRFAASDLQTVIVIGGGPAGLTAAYELAKVGIRPIVLEMGARVGGIARTEVFDGYRMDIGGHRFFTKVPEVEAFWYEVLGEDFLTRPRLSRIYYNRKFILYPLRFGDALSKLGVWQSLLVLLSYFHSKILPYRHENTFEEWVSNRFGKRLYRIFFKTYTEKVWGIPCDQLSAQWAAQRIQNLSLPPFAPREKSAIWKSSIPWLRKPWLSRQALLMRSLIFSICISSMMFLEGSSSSAAPWCPTGSSWPACLPARPWLNCASPGLRPKSS